jgi:hypothetical protein
LFLAAAAIVWLLFHSAYAAFPFVQNGAVAISVSKVHFLETQPAFSSGTKRCFGHRQLSRHPPKGFSGCDVSRVYPTIFFLAHGIRSERAP